MGFWKMLKWRMWEIHQHEIVETRNGYRLQRKDGTIDPNQRLRDFDLPEGGSITVDLNRLDKKDRRGFDELLFPTCGCNHTDDAHESRTGRCLIRWCDCDEFSDTRL